MKRSLLFFAFFSLILCSNAQVAATTSDMHESNETVTSQRAACDTLFSFDVLAEWASGIAWDGQNFWSGGFSTSLGAYAYYEMIYKYTPAGEIIDSIPAPSADFGVSGLTFDGTNLWGLLEEQDRLVSIDINNGNILTDDVYPELGTNGWDLSWDGTHIWIAGYSPVTLLKIDPATGDILDQLYPTAPLFTIECVGDFIYAATAFGAELYKLSSETGETLTTEPWCIPYQTGMCWDGAHMWTVSSRIDLGGHQKAFGVPLLGVTNIQSPSNQSAQSVFPNPAKDVVTVELDDRFSEWVDVQIFSLDGKLVRAFGKAPLSQAYYLELNTGSLNQGVYSVVVSSGETSITAKLVIQR